MFWDIFVALCSKHNIKPTAVVKQLGFAKGSVTNWKKGIVPHDVARQKIADFFGVNVKIFTAENDFSKNVDSTSSNNSNVVTIIGRNGSYTKKELSDEQAKLLNEFIKTLPNITDEL